MNTTCPISNEEVGASFLQRSGVPVNQNVLFSTKEAAQNMKRGGLDLRVCPKSGFVWNSAFDLSRVDYGEAYENTQSSSAVFRDHLDAICHMLVEEKEIRDCTIVDVGCGKGGFLRQLVEYPGSKNRGIGFDTSYMGPLEDIDGRLRFEQCYYDPSKADVPVDVIVCRHVIEHIPEPIEFLTSIRQTLKTHPHTRLFFETPDVDWILRNHVLYDFFYEHCSYFTLASLTTAFETAGFQVDEVRNVFGEQYQWLEASIPDALPEISYSPGETPKLAEEFGLMEEKFKKEVGQKFTEIADGKKVCVWGAGAKGVTFANLLDPEGSRIDCIVDLNPEKQGKYLPGTGHEIIDYHDLSKRGVSVAINMNPNYHQENLNLLKEAGMNVELAYLCPPYPDQYTS